MGYSKEVINRAKKLYDDGHTYTEIADLLEINRYTIFKWRKKYNWDNNAENDSLTEQQELFCIYYAKCLNATKSYKKAFNCSEINAMSKCGEILQMPKIRKRIDELLYEVVDKNALQKSILQKYIDIAFADITEFYEFNDEGVAHLKPDIDGTIITEVVTAGGEVKIKLADKMKALETLTKFSGLLDDDTRKKLEEENLRLRNEKLEVEIKLANGGDKEEYEDDGFIEAINRKVDDIWEEN